jgi:hypothetical protein
MTEAEWITCADPSVMERFLRDRASGRKWRLLAVACCRRIFQLFSDECHRNVLELAERYADGLVSGTEMVAARDAKNNQAWTAAKRTAREVARGPTGSTERAARCAFLRDLFGNPFRPVTVDPYWLAWNDGTVRRLARTIYDKRRFEDLPVLADALEDAGCTDTYVLNHCRAPGEHVRGCWVVDLLLGKS